MGPGDKHRDDTQASFKHRKITLWSSLRRQRFADFSS
jgi:hypothetical protein